MDVHVCNISRVLGKSCTFGFVLLYLCNDDEKYMLSQLTGPQRRETLGTELSLDLLILNSLRVMITREIHIDSDYFSNLPANLQICELVSA